MHRGDLVRCWILESLHERVEEMLFDPTKTGAFKSVPRVAVILEYEKTEKIATVLFQDTGKVGRVSARDIEIIERSPETVELLKALHKKQTKKP